MRGLDTRVLLARARILKLVDPEGGAEAEAEAMLEAEVDGYHDEIDGFNEPPAQFSDEPRLIEMWKSGKWARARMDITAECENCNDGTGNPCRIHG